MFSVNKKGQMTLFVILAFALVLIIIITFFVANNNVNTSSTLAQIESLEQASSAVEECLDDLIVDSFYSMGELGGYMSTMQGFSSFATPTSLLSIEDMENNLKLHLERNALGCSSVLDDTKFSVRENRPEVSVEFTDNVIISISSVGDIGNNGATQGITSRSEKINVNFVELHSIVENMLGSEYGIPITEYDGYLVNVIVSEDYSEQLVRLYHEESEFRFRITKVI